MHSWNWLSPIPDYSISFTFNAVQATKAFESGPPTIPKSILLNGFECTQTRCLGIMAAEMLTDPAGIPADLCELLDRGGGECEPRLGGSKQV